MKPFTLAALLLPLLATVALASAAPAGPTEAALWHTWDDGLREAGTSQRPIVVDVYTDWCGWCKRMDRDVFARNDVREYLSRRFVAIKLNAESGTLGQYQGKSLSSRALAAKFRVTGYPTTVFLTSGGDHLVNVPGYVNADRYLLLLRYVGDGHLDRGVPFQDFVKKSSGAQK